MKTLYSQIPNALTLTNLLLGCIGIWMVALGRIDFAFYALLAGAVFDFLDGFAARLLKVNSEIGKQLDSFSDLVSFGVLPGFMAMWWIENGAVQGILPQNEDWLGSILGLIIPICAAIRLARFNLDENQGSVFIGVPTPAVGLFISSVAYSIYMDGFWNSMLGTRESGVILVLLMGWLMNAPFKVIALKFKGLSFKGNELKWVMVFSSILLLVFLKFAAIPIIIGLLVVLSLFQKQNEIQS